MDAIGTSSISMSFPSISYIYPQNKDVLEKGSTSNKYKDVNNTPSWETIKKFIIKTVEIKCAEKIENSID